MLCPRRSSILARLGDHFIDSINHRLGHAKHNVMRRAWNDAVDSSCREARRLLMHRNYHLGPRVKVRVGVFRVR
jgi:hypothetical protein